MSEENTSRSKNRLLSILVIFLIAFAGVQTWYMVNMKQKLDTLSSADQTVNNTADIALSTTAPLPKVPPVALNNPPSSQTPTPSQKQAIPYDPMQAFNDDFFNHPFASQGWNPEEIIAAMQQDMERIFNGSFGQLNHTSNSGNAFHDMNAIPQLNMQEDNSKFTITMDLPGAKDNSFSVNLDGQQLTINGKQNFDEQKQDDHGNIVFQQHRSGQFQRSITLPEPVKPGSLVSHVDKGVLTITVSKMS
jgi:HSP20 family molecular chaperone IbpA